MRVSEAIQGRFSQHVRVLSRAVLPPLDAIQDLVAPRVPTRLQNCLCITREYVGMTGNPNRLPTTKNCGMGVGRAYVEEGARDVEKKALRS